MVFATGCLSGKRETVLNEVTTLSDGPDPNAEYVWPIYMHHHGLSSAVWPIFKWGDDQFACLLSLWNRESGWRVNAANSSGAYGIPQALPGSKMASAGADWQTNPATQIAWGLGYIAGRYGTPCGAWDHSESNGWY